MHSNVNKQITYHTEQEEQLEYLMLRFGKQVLKLAYYYVRDKYLAEDIYQEVFIRVYRNLDKFKHESSYYTWIYRITVNLCKDYLKSATFKKLITFGIMNDFKRSSQEANRLLEKVEGGEVFSLVMELPAKYRLPLSLHYFEGFSTSEIAPMLEITESNVKVRLHRGREKLKTLLSKEDK